MSLDLLSNLDRVIQQVSKDKGVSPSAVINSIVQGVLTAVRKKYGTYRDIEVKYNEELGELELFEFKKVVPDEEFEDELIEIKYSSAKELDPETQMGDQIGTRLELKDLGRIDAQTAKQIIIQNLRSIEHEIIFNEFEKRKGEVASGVVRRVDPGMIVVDLEKTEAYIPRKEQIPGEQYKSGDRIQGYLLEVRQTTRGPQIIMSRAHEQYLIKLFEAEVPEVHEGIVKIVAAAREPGQRAKMAVYSTDPAVHPVGSCVGIKGSRVQNITQELKGERVDVIIWEDDPVQYICNALAPAKISKVLVDEDQKQMQIIVPDDQLSLAIGKKGQNVRLAVKLTGWHLNLSSEQESKQAKKEALFSLSLIPDISETKAQSLFQYGYSSIEKLAEADPNELKSVPEFEDENSAKQLIQSAKELLKKYAQEGKELPKLQDAEKEKKPLSSNLKEQAEEILKRELAQLEGDKPDSPSAETSTDKTKAEEETKSTDEKQASSTEPKAVVENEKESHSAEEVQTAPTEAEKTTATQTTSEETKKETAPPNKEQTAPAEAQKETTATNQTDTAKKENRSAEEETISSAKDSVDSKKTDGKENTNSQTQNQSSTEAVSADEDKQESQSSEEAQVQQAPPKPPTEKNTKNKEEPLQK